MKGSYHIIVQNNRLRYEMDIRRNITIIRGDSATGKTTLFNLLDQAAALGESSGVEVICERPCRTLGGFKSHGRDRLGGIRQGQEEALFWLPALDKNGRFHYNDMCQGQKVMRFVPARKSMTLGPQHHDICA